MYLVVQETVQVLVLTPVTQKHIATVPRRIILLQAAHRVREAAVAAEDTLQEEEINHER